MTLAITRLPGPDLARCELTHLTREPIDLARAEAQHAEYRSLLEELGCEVVTLPPLDGHPDAPFVEDTAIVLDEVAILTRMGAESRRGESESVEAALAPHREIVRMEEPTTVDGGDVVRVGEMLYVGQSSRTNHPGLKALAHLVFEHRLTVKAVEVRGCLHLKTACTALSDEALIVARRHVNLERVRGLELVDAHPDEPAGADVLRVGGTIVLSATAPRTAERLDALGYDVRLLDVGEFEKAEAGVTCLSLLVEG